MKGSDSTNSLTELTGKSDDNTCFICLEESSLGYPLVDSKILRNCGCRFHVHTDCWNTWIKNKTDYDCPICHRASALKINIPPNPVLAFEEPNPPSNLQIRRLGCCLIASLAIGVSVLIIEKMMTSG